MHALQDSKQLCRQWKRSVGVCIRSNSKEQIVTTARTHQLSGSSSVDAIARCLSEYFQKQFELSDMITLQTGHTVRREFHFGHLKPECWILCYGIILYIVNIVAICNNSLSSKKNFSMHFNLVHLGVVPTI